MSFVLSLSRHIAVLQGPASQPARGLGHQQQLGLARQRDADLEQPPLAVGHEARRHVLAAGEADEPDDRRRLVPGLAEGAHGAPEIEAAPAQRGHRHPDVLEHRVVVEEVQDLERAADAQARPAVDDGKIVHTGRAEALAADAALEHRLLAV